MSRLENNTFTIYKELFNIRNAVKEVCDIMNFQLYAKNLKIEIDIKQNVPREIYSDQKRFKQVLFNLIGNAVKFTFQGGIKIRMEMQGDMLIT